MQHIKVLISNFCAQSSTDLFMNFNSRLKTHPFTLSYNKDDKEWRVYKGDVLLFLGNKKNCQQFIKERQVDYENSKMPPSLGL